MNTVVVPVPTPAPVPQSTTKPPEVNKKPKEVKKEDNKEEKKVGKKEEKNPLQGLFGVGKSSIKSLHGGTINKLIL